MMKTNKSFKGLQLFIKGTNIISQKINDFLSLLDPAFHRGLKNLKEFTLRFPAVKIFADVDSLLMGGRSLIFNRETPLHFDNRDLLTGWQVIIAGGDFATGGAVHIPKLRLRLRLFPGDMVAIRGRVLDHEIEPWDGGQRISLVHFTHESVWKYVEDLLMKEGHSKLSPLVGDILMRMGQP